jgi:hypothetical protein
MQPIFERIEAHVFAGDRLHGDDTTVPVLAKGKTDTGRCWASARNKAHPHKALGCRSPREFRAAV